MWNFNGLLQSIRPAQRRSAYYSPPAWKENSDENSSIGVLCWFSTFVEIIPLPECALKVRKVFIFQPFTCLLLVKKISITINHVHRVRASRCVLSYSWQSTRYWKVAWNKSCRHYHSKQREKHTFVLSTTSAGTYPLMELASETLVFDDGIYRK